MQGADRVNDELEVGFDQHFEERWHIAEVAGRGFMLLIVLAALLGFFGHGPFSHATQVDATKTLAVDYEPITRYGTSTQITLHLSGVHPDTESIHLSSKFAEPLGLQQVLPTPLLETAEKDGLTLTMATPPGGGDIIVRLIVKPSAIGIIPLSAKTALASIGWSMLVLP